MDDYKIGEGTTSCNANFGALLVETLGEGEVLESDLRFVGL